jgi:hypothetical protein
MKIDQVSVSRPTNSVPCALWGQHNEFRNIIGCAIVRELAW